MTKTPLYSVIIPTYNRAGLLPHALDSIFEQGIEDIQVVVVDDGSTDDTREVVTAYEKEIVYVYQDRQGPAVARNEAAARVTGAYVSFLDSDDVWLPNKISTEQALFRRFAAAEAIASDCLSFREGKLLSTWMYEELVQYNQGQPWLVHPTFQKWIYSPLFATCSITLKRTAFQRLGRVPFDTSLPWGEDWDFEIRMLHRCQLLICPEVLSHVRRFEDGTRTHRTCPGAEPDEEQERKSHEVQLYIAEKAIGTEGIPDSSRRLLAERIHELKTALAH